MYEMLSSAESTVFIESYRPRLYNGTFLHCATREKRDGKIILTSITAVLVCRVSIPLAARSKAWICRLSFAGIGVSNPAEGMDVCLL